LSLHRVRLGIEAEVRLRDLQAVVRRTELKQRDAELDRMVLLLAASRSNRDAVRGTASLLEQAFPLRPRAVLRALERGEMPSANGYVLL
jgi:hypothetical protein